MKVQLTTARVGASFVQEAGQTIDVDDAEAQRLFDAGQAEPVGAADRRDADRQAAAPPAGRRTVSRPRG